MIALIIHHARISFEQVNQFGVERHNISICRYQLFVDSYTAFALFTLLTLTLRNTEYVSRFTHHFSALFFIASSRKS